MDKLYELIHLNLKSSIKLQYIGSKIAEHNVKATKSILGGCLVFDEKKWYWDKENTILSNTL